MGLLYGVLENRFDGVKVPLVSDMSITGGKVAIIFSLLEQGSMATLCNYQLLTHAVSIFTRPTYKYIPIANQHRWN